MKNKPKYLNLVLMFVFIFSALGLMPKPVLAAPSELFFSEYIEGSSNNKALEIYNGTGTEVDLGAGNYQIKIYFNGSTNAGFTATLVGTIANGDVFVFAHSSADPAILEEADQTTGAGLFNGDDAVVLQKGDEIIDVIGQIGVDPGSEWGSGETSTADNTLRRKENICQGDPDGSNPFDPSVEWDGYPNNTFDGLGTHTAICRPISVLELKINEFVADHVGTDTNEYIEVFGEPLTDYSDHTLLQVEGDGAGAGVIDSIHPVGTTDENGIWWTGYLYNVIENGTVSLLLVKNFTGSVGNDIDTTNDGVIDNPLWSEIVDSVAVYDGGSDDRAYGLPVLFANYDGVSTYKPGGASRIPDGYDTDSTADWVRNNFYLVGIPDFTGTIVVGEAYNTPGALNEVYTYTPPPEACGDPYTPIYDIQGSGMSTPIAGLEVATEGVVVGDFQEGGKNGFYIQDPIGDGDQATSDGIFIYAPGSMDVNVGDHVRVRGTAGEYFEATQISSSQLWLCGTGLPLPQPTELVLPVTDVYGFEQLEGMLVTIPQDLVIAEYFNFDRYGEIMLTTQRFMTFTALYEPDVAGYQASLDEYFRNSITLDDGRTNQNPDPAIHPNGLEFNLNNLFRGGDLVANVTGILDYGFNLYRIQPTQGADYTPVNPRQGYPNIMEGDLKIASFNVLNYFTTLDNAGWICGPSGDMECRGADDANELARQRVKILAALSTINADVVGLIEIENDRPGLAPDYPTADLVAGLNEILGAGTYDYIPTGPIGTDAIKLALIYKPAKVTPVGNFAILDSTVDPRFLDGYNRPVLAAAFMDNLSKKVFTVAVNHLKSKGSSCDAIGDPDLGDGAGNCNLTRLAAAEALVDWLATDPTGSGMANYLIIGDLNSYDKEAPITAIKAGPDGIPGTEDDYFDLIHEILGEYAYSYVFDGKIGYLDYALANTYFARYIDDVTVWHINADEPDLIDYDTSFKLPAQQAIFAPDAFRSSDHDPVIVTLSFYYDFLVDIMPGSCENPLNVKRPGVLPVAILGTADFDVTMIDPASITLAGVAPLRWSYEDVSSAYDCAIKGGDGYLDLVFHFDAQQISLALGEVNDGDLIILNIAGTLIPEFGGVPAVGEDMVWILRKGK